MSENSVSKARVNVVVYDAVAVAAITAGTYYLMKTLGKLASCVF